MREVARLAPLLLATAMMPFMSRGLTPFGGEESVWFVSGVRPFTMEAFLLLVNACALWLKFGDAVLFSESAEPMPWRASPGSDWCISSESGEMYGLATLPFAAAAELWLVEGSESEVVPFANRALFVGSWGEAPACENSSESRLRFSEPGEALRRPPSTTPPDCDMMPLHLTCPPASASLATSGTAAVAMPRRVVADVVRGLQFSR